MLRLQPGLASYSTQLRSTLDRLVPADDAFFVLPRMPTLYGVLGRKAPFPQLYLNWLEEEHVQREMIDAIERQQVDWGLVVTGTLDARRDLVFPRTHPLVWQHLQREFRRVPTPELPRSHVLMKRARDRYEGP